MQQENTKANTRYSVKQMYCTQQVADAVNNHPWLECCITGNDRAQRLLEALDFANQHYDNGNYTQASNCEKELQNQIDRLTAENETLQEQAAKAETLNARICELEGKLQTAQDEAGTNEEGNLRLAEEIHSLKQTIAAKDAEIQALQSEQINWQKIATAFDPAYTAVVEEITRRLNQKYHHEATPQDVLMSFFMRYYYKQEAEFNGMPFVIRPREIMQLIRTVYPEMTDKILSKALGTIQNKQ